MSTYFSIQWQDGRVCMLDQRLLPHEIVYRHYEDDSAVAQAIRDMVIRGAPAIGAAAAYGLALAAMRSRANQAAELHNDLRRAADRLRGARPTAVNLFWAIDRVLSDIPFDLDGDQLRTLILQRAHAIAHEDRQINRALAQHGLALVPDNATIIHHCNTGSLATVDYGTALGVIRAAHEAGKRVHVIVDETRPRLQGLRLTTWELDQLGIPHTVIVDGAAAHVMRTRRVDLCIVGCDRVAANGDTANKIGTYHLAVAARAHNVPFYVAAPYSTIDLQTPSGNEIEIESRSDAEITAVESHLLAPEGTPVYNPAFDITPAEWISAWITERGILHPPFRL